MRHPDPTPLEIRTACREIQDTWQPRQEWNHAGKPTRRWKPQTVRVSDLAAAADEEMTDEGERD